MKVLSNASRIGVFLFASCTPLFFINIQELHSWGDDFALYITEAQNIVDGRPFNETTWLFNPYNPNYSPPQYPAGYPLMLAPVVGIFGQSIIAINYFNSIIASCLLFALYAFFRNYTGKTAAACMAIMISYSGCLVALKSNILADVPCLLLLTLYLWLRERRKPYRYRMLLLISLAVCAIQVRTQSIFILPAEAGIWLITGVKAIRVKRPDWLKHMLAQPQAYIIPGVLTVHYLIGTFILRSSASTLFFYFDIYRKAYEQSSLSGTWYGIVGTIGASAALPWPGSISWEEINIATTLAIIVACMAVVGFFLKIATRVTVSDFFFLGMVLLMMYFPSKDPRYYLPLFPIFGLYAYFSAMWLARLHPVLNTAYVAIAITVVYFIPDFEHLKKVATETPGGCIPAQREVDAFRYIKMHVNDNDVIAFTKPRAIALYTGKRTVNISWCVSHEENKRVFDSIGVKYVLTLGGFDDGIFLDYMRAVNPPTDSVIIGAGYTLYSVL